MATAIALKDAKRGKDRSPSAWISLHGFKLAFLLPAALVYAIFLLVPIVDSMRMSFYGGSSIPYGASSGAIPGWAARRRRY